MPRWFHLPLVAAAGLFAIAAMAQTAAVPTAAKPGSASAATPAPSAQDDKALFEGSCAACHDLSQASGQATDEAGWKETIARMVGYGAVVTPEQADRLSRYLAAVHGTTPAGTAAPTVPAPK